MNHQSVACDIAQSQRDPTEHYDNFAGKLWTKITYRRFFQAISTQINLVWLGRPPVTIKSQSSIQSNELVERKEIIYLNFRYLLNWFRRLVFFFSPFACNIFRKLGDEACVHGWYLLQTKIDHFRRWRCCCRWKIGLSDTKSLIESRKDQRPHALDDLVPLNFW